MIFHKVNSTNEYNKYQLSVLDKFMKMFDFDQIKDSVTRFPHSRQNQVISLIILII